MLIFTIVTIIFVSADPVLSNSDTPLVRQLTSPPTQLPMSFLASFFAISIQEFPKDTGSGQPDWPLRNVSQYLCKPPHHPSNHPPNHTHTHN